MSTRRSMPCARSTSIVSSHVRVEKPIVYASNSPIRFLYYDARVRVESMVESIRWPNYFDVVILPSAAVRDHSIALSRKLQKYGAKFVLGRRRYLPHISLYHIPVKPED